MFALQCTRRAFGQWRCQPGDALVPATTRLGDWCANVIPLGRGEVVLAVSMRSLLPVPVPKAPVERFLQEFLGAAAEVLHRIGVSPAAIQASLGEMKELRLTRTSSRQVLGSMTDFVSPAEGVRALA
jgi:hypothetical protein